MCHKGPLKNTISSTPHVNPCNHHFFHREFGRRQMPQSKGRRSPECSVFCIKIGVLLFNFQVVNIFPGKAYPVIVVFDHIILPGCAETVRLTDQGIQGRRRIWWASSMPLIPGISISIQ